MHVYMIILHIYVCIERTVSSLTAMESELVVSWDCLALAVVRVYRKVMRHHGCVNLFPSR